MNLNLRILSLILFAACTTNFSNIQTITFFGGKKTSKQSEADAKAAEELLNMVKNDFQKLRVSFADALEKGTLNTKDVDDAVRRLKDAFKRIKILDGVDSSAKSKLRPIAKIIDMSYKALLEEVLVLELWSHNYEGYEKDLTHNLRNLPNASVKKPDNKKIYEELGFKSADEGKNASFNAVRQKYQQRYNALKSKPDFDKTYFSPYLRAIEYFFRTPYSKVQYDTYLQGAGAYNAKANNLKKYSTAVKKITGNPDLAMLNGEIASSLK